MKKTSEFNRRLFLALPATVALASQEALAGPDIFLLVNSRNPTSSLSRGDTKNYFLGKTAFWHGVVPVKLFTRPGASEPGKKFYEPVLGMSPQAFAQHWSKLQLAGKGVTPPQVGDVATLASKVAKVPGGIAFVLGAEAWKAEGVKVIPIT